jgi:alpha/beta superfamily hydrolase
MECELVQVTTPGLTRLHGAWFRSTVARQSSIDAALLLHGLAGNFYSSRLMQSLARRLVAAGVHVLSANTRGHDGLNWTSSGGRTILQGAALESVADCCDDIAGWVRFLLERGCRSIALAGHSLGAIKALFAQVHQPHGAVACVIAISASRLNYFRFLESPAHTTFERQIAQAEQAVAMGQPDQLLRVEFPFPAYIAAWAYVDKYGPGQRYDWTLLADRLRVPVLLTFGQRELANNVAFAGILDQVEALRAQGVSLTTRVIPSADHFYNGRRQVLSKAVQEWLIREFPPPANQLPAR